MPQKEAILLKQWTQIKVDMSFFWKFWTNLVLETTFFSRISIRYFYVGLAKETNIFVLPNMYLHKCTSSYFSTWLPIFLSRSESIVYSVGNQIWKESSVEPKGIIKPTGKVQIMYALSFAYEERSYLYLNTFHTR